MHAGTVLACLACKWCMHASTLIAVEVCMPASPSLTTDVTGIPSRVSGTVR